MSHKKPVHTLKILEQENKQKKNFIFFIAFLFRWLLKLSH